METTELKTPRKVGRPKNSSSLAGLINKWDIAGYFRIICIYGFSGVGKSSYCWQVLQELYPDLAKLDKDKPLDDIPEYLWDKDKGPYYNDLRQLLIFSPRELISFARYTRKHNLKYKCLMIDDAGLHFSADSYYDPVIQAASKYLQVCRSNVTSLLFTSTKLSNIVSTIRSGDVLNCRITPYKNHLRYARGYQQSTDPMGHLRIRALWEDSFSKYIRNDLFEWYSKVRNSYTDSATDLMEKALQDKEDVEQWRNKKYGR